MNRDSITPAPGGVSFTPSSSLPSEKKLSPDEARQKEYIVAVSSRQFGDFARAMLAVGIVAGGVIAFVATFPVSAVLAGVAGGITVVALLALAIYSANAHIEATNELEGLENNLKERGLLDQQGELMPADDAESMLVKDLRNKQDSATQISAKEEAIVKTIKDLQNRKNT